MATKRALVIGLTVALLGWVAPAPGRATPSERFSASGLSHPRFEIGPPERVPVVDRHGRHLHVEVRRPYAGGDPVSSVPTLLAITPYGGLDVLGPFTEVAAKVHGLDPDATVESEIEFFERWTSYFVPRGYAVAVAHVPGTGDSDGCWDAGGPGEVEGNLAIVDALAHAPWSVGRIGMFGASDAATSQWLVATSGDARAEAVQAIAPQASRSGWYEFMSGGDAVPLGPPSNTPATNFIGSSAVVAAPTPDAGTAPNRPVYCQVEGAEAMGDDLTYSYNEWYREREWRERIGNVRSAVLMMHGLRDQQVYAFATVGSFEALPHGVPKHLVLGQWGHVFGDRSDNITMQHAWFDRYLLDLDTGVEQLPAVQVEDTRGAWRAERTWPTVQGSAGQLALSAGGTLGGSAEPGAVPGPADDTTFYREVPTAAPIDVEGPDSAVFRTSTLSRPLHLSGVAVADLWLTLDRDDAHVAVQLRAVDADGTPLDDQPPVLWSRSAQHLDSIDRGFARQVDARPVTPGNAIRVRVRLHPTDLIVPAGARLELKVSGTLQQSLATQPSGKATGVTIHHDCTRPSTLRFLVSHQVPPRPQNGADALQTSLPASLGVREDGGIASAKVCGAKPLAPSA